jgi:hypothetical protein
MDHARRPSEPTSAQFIDIRRIPAQMFSNLVYNCYSSGMVRCIGLVPTSFREKNSSAVSRTLRREKARGSGFNFVMRFNVWW